MNVAEKMSLLGRKNMDNNDILHTDSQVQAPVPDPTESKIADAFKKLEDNPKWQNVPDQTKLQIKELLLNKEGPALEKLIKKNPFVGLNRSLYIMVQVFNIAVTGAFYSMDFAYEKTFGFRLHWIAVLVISLVAGHIGYKLASKEIQRKTREVEKSVGAFPAFMFSHYKELLTALIGTSYSVVIGIIIQAILYGTLMFYYELSK